MASKRLTKSNVRRQNSEILTGTPVEKETSVV
jgi:hypothetical protein